MNYVSKNFKNVVSILFVGLLTTNSFAQGENLLSNGGFESTDGKVKKLGGIESATTWTSPTGVRADLFTPGKVIDISTPMNIYGKEEAKEGSNYAGIVAFSFGDKVPRSYIMAKLDSPLKKGMKYCVSFHVSLAEASKYASNNIGANLSKKPFATDSKTAIIDEAHIKHYNNKVFNATYNWDKVCGIFEAEGGEKYITIGNFDPNDKTKYENNKKPNNKEMKLTQVISAYYYIDDISIQLIDNNEQCDCLITENENNYSSTIYQKAVVLNDKMTSAEKVEAQKVFFAFGKTTLTTEGEEALDLIAEEMKANASMKLEVMGHSDAEEDKVGLEKEMYADMASKRVNEVMSYLMDKGIEEGRMIPSSQGSSEPSDEIEEGDDDDLIMAKNRRVTFKVR
ncbi:MAG: OmpA family protein [Bacteroidetes bacterium]|nr:MAG: OmpA family protein [Bacteroidota bacterium]